MLKIALTGNIASGKTLFEECLKLEGFRVLCLDSVTHKLYRTSAPLKDFLLKKFNTTERNKVAASVFNKPKLKAELENFIYPLILAEMNKFFNNNRHQKFLFVSASMLYEAGFEKYFDKVVLICADENLRLQRLIKRNNLSEANALRRIKAQIRQEKKAKRADYIIDNNGTEYDLRVAAKRFIEALQQH